MARKLPPADVGLSPLAESLNDLGKIVRNARAHGQLRIDAAALLGVSSDLLSRLENGKPVTTDRLFKTLDGFGLQILVLPKAIAQRMAKASGSVEPLP
jgi:transcriptional regulator with XRE-family HTH domain